jgi:hypothetical protein
MNRMQRQNRGRGPIVLRNIFSDVGRVRVVVARAPRRAWSLGWQTLLVLALVACTFTGVPGPGSAQGRARNAPPPIPQCYYTGSGYGSCEGYVVPGGGTVVPMTYPDKNGVFKLSGPAPLQFREHVACGDLGCIFNHLDWNYAAGIAVSGCATNTSTCSVKLTTQQYAWRPVYVRQNNDPPIIYLLWLSGKTGGSIRGYVREKNMKGALQGVVGVTVTATGPKGSGSATTGDQGFYTMNVRPGDYKVVSSLAPSGKASLFSPESRSASVSAGGIARADFSMKLTPASVQVSFAASTNKGGPLTVGKPVDIAVTVTAGKVYLSSVSLGGGLVASNDKLQVVTQATGISGFPLARGTSRTFVFQVQGVSPGSGDVSVKATATSDVGDVSDTAKLSLKVAPPSLKVLSVRPTTDSINIQYVGRGWNPNGGPIAMSFSGVAAGQLVQQADFDGTLKIAYWPHRTSDAAITTHPGSGYCWGELAARQGTLFATTGQLEGKWAGWVLWSADPRIKAHEAYCEGEPDTMFRHSPFPIITFGHYEGSDGVYKVVAFNVSGPNTASPPMVLPQAGIYISLPMYNVCIAIKVNQGTAVLSTTTSPGNCVVPKTSS